MKVIEVVAENGYLSFVAGRKGLLRRLMLHEEKMELTAMLKLVGMMTNMLEGDRLLLAAHRNLNRTPLPYTPAQLHLISSTLCTLVAQLPAKPLYTYQHLSCRPSSSATIQSFCHSLYTALSQENTPALPGLVAFLSSSLSKAAEPLHCLTADRNSAVHYFKALQRHWKSLKQPGDLALNMLNQVKETNPILEEYFQVAKLICIQGFGPIQKLKTALESGFLELLRNVKGETKDWGYAIATLSILQAQNKRKSLKDHIESTLSKIHIRSLYGEVLIWAVVAAGELPGRENMIIDGIPNLSYLNSEENIDPSLVKSLFLTLSNLRNSKSFNSDPLLPLIERFSGIFDKEMLKKCHSLLYDIAEDLPAELSSKLQRLEKEIGLHTSRLHSKLEKNRRKNVYDESLVNEVIEAVNSSPQVPLFHSLLSYLSCTSHSSTHLPVLLKLLPLASPLPLFPLTNLLFLHLSSPVPVPTALLPSFTQALSSLQFTDMDQLVLLGSGLKGYLPFHRLELEERRVGSEDKDWEKRERREEEGQEIWWKANAVMNAFHLQKPTVVHEALKHLVSSRSSSDLRYCTKDFLTAASPVPADSSVAFYQDPATGWVIDVAFPESTLAIIFQGESELVQSPESGEISSTLLAKVWKEQLKAVGWKVVGVKKRVWQHMSETDKAELVRRIRSKA